MQPIVKFIECLIPITLCNLKCHYCYVIQRENRKMKHAQFRYPIDHMLKCLIPERFGGRVYFSLCGAGETMLCPELPFLVKGLLDMGHIVNITTNGTCSKQLDSLIGLNTPKNLSSLHFSFSFHYLELLRLGIVDDFFNNVRRVRDAGCSFFVQFNLTDEYIPYLEEIKKLVFDNTGAYPQVAATRKENDLKKDIALYTAGSRERYKEIGDQFKSPLFEYTMANFDQHRKEYCYAGEVSYVLNLATGILQACYASIQRINIFANSSTSIKLKAMGYHCPSRFCMNSSHFMSMGVIPSHREKSYADLRNRVTKDGLSWYNEKHKELLSKPLPVKEYSLTKKAMAEIQYYTKKMVLSVYSIIPNGIKDIYRKQKDK